VTSKESTRGPARATSPGHSSAQHSGAEAAPADAQMAAAFDPELEGTRPTPFSIQDLFGLQRTLGNAAVSRMLGRADQPWRGWREAASPPAANYVHPAAVRRMAIDKLPPTELATLQAHVARNEYKAALDLVLLKLPAARHKRGIAAVLPVADFATVVDPAEIPRHGGYAVTTGGRMYDEPGQPPKPTIVYVSQQWIKTWVETGQIGSMVTTIEHELTHAHQVNDAAFIREYPSAKGAEGVARGNAMEFEAYATELRGVYFRLKDIGFADERAATLELPTEYEIEYAFENMSRHYKAMSPQEQKKYEELYVKVSGYFPVVKDFINRNVVPPVLLETFLHYYNTLAQNTPHVLVAAVQQVSRFADAKTAADTTYNSLRTQFSQISLVGLAGDELKAKKTQREQIKTQMTQESAARAKADPASVESLQSLIKNRWDPARIKVYQTYVRMNSSLQLKYKAVASMFDIMGNMRALGDLKTVEDALIYLKAAIKKWNEQVAEIEKTAGSSLPVVPPVMVSDTPIKALAPGGIAAAASDAAIPEAKPGYIAELKALMAACPYVQTSIAAIAPDGLEGFDLPTLRENLVAAQQGKIVYDKIVALAREKPLVRSQLDSMGPAWHHGMTPKQLFGLYQKLAA
jgi:hypothetical protein